MAFFEHLQHVVAERFHGRDDEQTSQLAKLRKEIPPFQDVLDLGREIEGHLREFGVKTPDDVERVAGAVQKIGIPERNMRRSGLNLPPDVLHDNILGHQKESSLIHGNDGAMAAGMETSMTGLDVADRTPLPFELEVCILVEVWKPPPTRNLERPRLHAVRP